MIRNLLFDLGGVVMDIRRQDCVDAFVALGMNDADKYLGEYSQSGPFGGIENGEYSVERFHNEIRSIIGRNVTDWDIDEAFGKFLVGIPVHRLSELERLHRRYGMYILSNTNPIMWADGIARNFGQLGHDVNYYFDGVVRSYEAGAMKPDPRIFETVISRFGIKPGETLFLDDSEKNLGAAQKFGFRTLLVSPGHEFYALLEEYPGIELDKV